MDYVKIGVLYQLCVNTIAFLAYGIDKWKAKKDRWRTKESTLLGLCLVGGCFGGYLGMKVFHHKTRKPRFRYGVPVMMVLWVVLLSAGVRYFL